MDEKNNVNHGAYVNFLDAIWRGATEEINESNKSLFNWNI